METWMAVIVFGGAFTACFFGHWVAFSLLRKRAEDWS